MDKVLASSSVNSAAEAEAYVNRILGEIQSLRDEMKLSDRQIANFREEISTLKADFGKGATEGAAHIHEMNTLLNRLFPSSPSANV